MPLGLRGLHIWKYNMHNIWLMQFILYGEFLLFGHFFVSDNRFYLENLSEFLTYGKYENVSCP